MVGNGRHKESERIPMTEGTLFTPAAQDAYMHPPSSDPLFNESAFYQLIDQAAGFSLLVRLGNRVNEGHAEMTVLACLPDGRTGIQFRRVPIADNSRFSAGGLSFDVVEPLKRNTVRYSGTLHVMGNASELEDPKTVFTSAPEVSFTFDLAYRDIFPVYDVGGALRGAGALQILSTGHYQGPTSATGEVTIGDERLSVRGYGFRDHSWGPRNWQGPDYWRWVSGIVDDDNWYEVLAMKIAGERQPDFGIVCRNGKVSYSRSSTFDTSYEPVHHYPSAITAGLDLDGERLAIPVRLTRSAPLRHRRDGDVARIMEMIVETELDGRPAVGFSEYHDRMVHGRPVGMGEV